MRIQSQLTQEEKMENHFDMALLRRREREGEWPPMPSHPSGRGPNGGGYISTIQVKNPK